MGKRILVEQVERMMGTRVDAHLSVPTEESDAASAALRACFDWLREVETALTRFNPTSELCQLNDAAGEWRTVSQLVFDAVEQAILAARATDGLFDPTLLTLLEKLGYDRDFNSIVSSESEEQPDEQEAVAETPQTGLWRKCELDKEGLRIKLPPGAKLDLGGIAKGWAADQALERFFGAFPNVILNVGGDMRVRGEKEQGEPWALGIGDPRDEPETEAPEHAIVLTLRQGGLATSGATTRWWRKGGRRQHHLLDPRTGQPARIWIDPTDDAPTDGDIDDDVEVVPLIATATALAPSAAEAEVAAKVALLRGYPDALQSVASAWDATANSAALYGDARVALLLILGTGDIVTSSHLPQYLATQGGGGEVWVD